ncbi:MAG: hypothetical protein M3308_00510, partial [Actinomycetota bacterium]|nr:hypothetical protein [Actinomycetota bacterium]
TVRARFTTPCASRPPAARRLRPSAPLPNALRPDRERDAGRRVPGRLGRLERAPRERDPAPARRAGVLFAVIRPAMVPP